MHLAVPLPWWLAVVLAAAVAAAAFAEYRRPLAPLTALQRAALVAFRVVVLAVLVLFLFRPVAMLPPAGSRDAIVPVLVDASRSMRLSDADGRARIDRAADLLKRQLLPSLGRQFSTELFAVGDGVAPTSVDRLTADARRTDLGGALAAIRDRYRGQRVAGIVLISDGADTTGADGAGRAGGAARAGGDGPPIYTVGVGAPDGPRDREVLGIQAGDPRLDHASVDLHVTAVSSGFGRAPFQLRLLANGQPADTRRLVPQADGSPIDVVFTVSPNPQAATVYTAEIAADDSELVRENNTRSVLVSPAGRKRRILAIEGAPGFEHSFMTRALAADPGLEVDTVTRKGKNDQGADTFFVQAAPGRSAILTGGFPATRDKLFAYDALVIANVEGDFFARAQLSEIADFVSERGGGLLVLGGRSFTQRGLAGTPLEEVLPVELNDRRGGLVRTSYNADDLQPHNRVTVTTDGESHPVMRIGATPEETRKAWAALPALAAAAPLGAPRPGASVLAVTTSPDGAVHPLVAVQRYGRGRAMVFAGEASWRWKMMMASTDRSYEFFWRQAARWLSSHAPDPVEIAVPDSPEPGDAISIDVETRDASFAAVPDAIVEATLAAPGAGPEPLKLRRADIAAGRFTAAVRPDRPGLYRVHAEARRGSTALGSSDRWMLVGGADREFTDPRLNEGWLRRAARDSGGRYVRANDAGKIAGWLSAAVPQHAAPERRDLWHEPWAFAAIIALLSAEWILRRRWGLR
ncbi:MAG TPA: glutamine amidotransferase [Vicinamibacterales bacterium]|nr:glutamine amidotransferase [Vicinamibacterales bacterium]